MHQDSSACQIRSTEKFPSRTIRAGTPEGISRSPRAQGGRHPGGHLPYSLVSYNSQGWAHEDAGCFCYFLRVHKETESWGLESSKVYLLGCGFLSCEAEGRPHAKMSSYRHELRAGAGRGGGRSGEESVTASDDLQGSCVCSSEDKKVEEPASPRNVKKPQHRSNRPCTG